MAFLNDQDAVLRFLESLLKKYRSNVAVY
jgi:hypothetical protein